MFTGIIEEMGEVVSLSPTAAGSAVLTLRAGAVLQGLEEGGSLAVNGVCLTLATEASQPEASPPETTPEASPPATSTEAATSAGAATSAEVFVAHVMGETLTRTTLGSLGPGDPVNLERCPRAVDRFDGHIVQGHVDGTGSVSERVDEGDWVRMRFAVPADLAPFTAEKGSIAIDGVSLTLSAVSEVPSGPGAPDPSDPGTDHWVEVGLIPATLAATRMGALAVGDPVNIEVDIIAKYAARLTQFNALNATATHEGVQP